MKINPFNSRFLTKFAVALLISALFIGCGNSGDDDDDETVGGLNLNLPRFQMETGSLGEAPNQQASSLTLTASSDPESSTPTNEILKKIAKMNHEIGKFYTTIERFAGAMDSDTMTSQKDGTTFLGVYDRAENKLKISLYPSSSTILQTFFSYEANWVGNSNAGGIIIEFDYDATHAPDTFPLKRDNGDLTSLKSKLYIKKKDGTSHFEVMTEIIGGDLSSDIHERYIKGTDGIAIIEMKANDKDLAVVAFAKLNLANNNGYLCYKVTTVAECEALSAGVGSDTLPATEAAKTTFMNNIGTASGETGKAFYTFADTLSME